MIGFRPEGSTPRAAPPRANGRRPISELRAPSDFRANLTRRGAAGLDATRSVMSGVAGRLAVVRGASRRVAVQIADYGCALRAHADAIRSSHRRVAQNLLVLEGAFAASRR